MESPTPSYLSSWVHLMIGAMLVLSLVVVYGYVTNNGPLPLALMAYINASGWVTITGGVFLHWLDLKPRDGWDNGAIDYAVTDLALCLGMTGVAAALVYVIHGG